MNNFLYQAQLIEDIISNQKLTELKKDYKNISLKYRKENINSSTVVSSKNQALSYVSSRMPETSVIIDSVLDKINQLIDIKTEIQSVIDLGSGTGSALWALENYVDKIDVFAVEKQEPMIKYSKELSKNLDLNISYIQEDVLSEKVEKLNSADLVLESFMLNEMNAKDRTQTLDLMIKKANKYIVLIEPGTPVSYQKMMQDRAYLLSKDLQLVLPCMHNKNCPLKDDYCNFTVRVNRTKALKQIKEGLLGYEDEKYFYLVFSKEEIQKDFNSIVIRKPVYRKSCIDLKLCKGDATIQNTTITKNNKQNYAKAKDLKHGDLFNLNI
ncbi:MAG: methyltransferase domain-containing protein [Clostridia bacterium]|nr:methyltransferase domain-containing protein [Clostridia bacterium]